MLIEHGVSPPPSRRGKGSIYPFRELTDVGDAFFIPAPHVGEKGDIATENTLRSLCCYWGKKQRWADGRKRQFLMRYIKHHTGRYGYQITRTA